MVMKMIRENVKNDSLYRSDSVDSEKVRHCVGAGEFFNFGRQSHLVIRFFEVTPCLPICETVLLFLDPYILHFDNNRRLSILHCYWLHAETRLGILKFGICISSSIENHSLLSGPPDYHKMAPSSLMQC